MCVCMHACVCARMCACGFSWIRAHRVEKCVRDTGDDFYDQCCKIYTISSGWIGLKILDKKKSYDCCAIRFVCVSKDPPSFFLFFFWRCRASFFSRIESFYALDAFEGGFVSKYMCTRGI